MKDKNKNRKGYKETKVGWIPISWTFKKLKEFTIIKSGGTPSKTNTSYWDGTIPWISSSDLTEDSIYSISINKHITQQAITKSATKLIPSNSILVVSRVGVGKVAINYCPICTSQDFHNLIFDSNKVNPIFLAVSVKLKTIHLSLKKQGTSISGFLKKDLESTGIPLPPLPEQKAIASVLECWDKAIQKYKEKIEKKKNIKKGLMQKLLSGEQRLPGFDGEWEYPKVKEYYSIGRGRVISKSYIAAHKGKYPVFSSQTKNDGCLGYIETYDFDGEYITWTTDGANAGSVFFRKGKFNCTNVCGTAYRIGLNSNTLFHSYYLNSCAKRYVSYIGNPKLMNNIFANIPIPLPHLSEQKAIASILSSADSEIKALEKKLALLRDQKKYLLNNLVTGTIRLPEFCKEVG